LPGDPSIEQRHSGLFFLSLVLQLKFPSMRTRIKICGITRLEDALTACDAGADALGFNFSTQSPRSVTPETARAIIEKLPPFITCTGIFVEQTPDEINRICSGCRLAAAQLHSDRYTPEKAKSVTAARIIRVFRPGPGFRVDHVRNFAAKTGVNCFLFDAYRPNMAGGTGELIDPSTAVDLVEQTRNLGYAVLAGGLKPENVAEAIRTVRPYAVDTASGVESAPGIKDHRKIRAFIESARQADRL
jgi:phosphoribosylanthranilate isomerase